MTDLSDGTKPPPKPFIVKEGRRKARGVVLRCSSVKPVLEAFQRVATRGLTPVAGCCLRLRGDD